MKSAFGMSFLLALVLFATGTLPAQEPYDGTHLFTDRGHWLADNATKRTLAETRSEILGVCHSIDTTSPTRGRMCPKSQDGAVPEGTSPKLGDEAVFKAGNLKEGKFEDVPAVLRRIGKNCYIYVAKGVKISEVALGKAMHAFDDRIYPTNTSTFGSEWNPGIDGDPHVTLFFLDIKDNFHPVANPAYCAGYFNPGDEYSKTEDPNSNQREMVYLDTFPGDPEKPEYFSLLAHEFQHMIHWHHDPKELTWVDESLSMTAAVLNGFGQPGQLVSFMKNSDNNMCAWQADHVVANYGQAYLFASYLLAHVGKTEEERRAFLRTLVEEKAQGMTGVTSSLRKSGVDVPACKVFSRACVANFLNQTDFATGVYGHGDTLKDLKLQPFKTHSETPCSGNGSVKCWSARSVEIGLGKAQGDVRISFQADCTRVGSFTNDFDVAAILIDSRHRTPPSVEWLDMRSFQTDQILKDQSENRDRLMLVICNTGIECPEREKEFAEKAGPASFSYSVTVGEGSGTAVCIAPQAEIGSILQSLAEDRTTLAAHGCPNPLLPRKSISEEIRRAESEKLDAREERILKQVKASLDEGDDGPAIRLMDFIRACPPASADAINSLSTQVQLLIRFKVFQEKRDDLRPLLQRL